jgi:predicted ATPase
VPRKIGYELRIKIQNMGPVKAAQVDLTPLVIFIGPNNAGKSVIATLLYASLSQTGVASSIRIARTMRRLLDESADDIGSDVYSFIEEAISVGGVDSYSRMPATVKMFFETRLNESLEEYMLNVAEEIVRITGITDMNSIRRMANKRATPASMRISSSSPAWEVSLKTVPRGGPKISLSVRPDLHDVWRAIPPAAWQRLKRLTRPTSRTLRLNQFLSELARACFSEVPSHTRYLPAARSGLLQSHKALAGSLVRRSTLAGIEAFRIPAMSGVVADFLSEMIELDVAFRGDFSEEAGRLERDVLHGEVGLLGDGETTPEVIYRTPSAEYPLARTSSMVSELAPVVLYLRHRLRRGDLLLIEEPEAHLHPGTQIAFARCLVRLVNAGLRITLTTHSEFFLQQVNNAIVAGALGTSVNGISETESLEATAVSAYLFAPSANKTGTVVEKLPIDAEGIPDSSFSEISERLYNEAVVLDRSIDRAKGS